jgi:hypothetical protein
MADDVVIPAAAADMSTPGAAPVVPELPPMSTAEAASRKTEFLANKEKTTKLLNGDVGAKAEWDLITQNLWQPPQVNQPRDEVTNHLQESSGFQLSPEVLEEFRSNRPVTSQEHQMARSRLESRKMDPDWLRRYFRGDLEVRKEVALINSILSRVIRDNPQT